MLIKIPSTSKNQKTHNPIVCMVREVQVEYLEWAPFQVLIEELPAISIKTLHKGTEAVMELEVVEWENKKVVHQLMEEEVVVTSLTEVESEEEVLVVVSVVELEEEWDQISEVIHTMLVPQLASIIIKKTAKEHKALLGLAEVE